METFNEDEEKILFWNNEGDYAFLSNFSIYPLMYEGMLWPTTEHAYQSAKFDNQKIKEEIFNARTPLEAFNIGRTYNDSLKKDWFEIMEDIVSEKIKQYPIIYNKLIETGDREIIEASPIDSFWGWGSDRKGENNMGKIWMKLRAEILNKKR